MALSFANEANLRHAIIDAGGAFITGTDTDAGKTMVSRELLNWLNQSCCAVGYKPVASGAERTEHGLRNDDALVHQQASCGQPPYEQINPICFEPAIAPHLAAPNGIDTSLILEGYKRLREKADVVIVEGAGGWQVPLNDEYSIENLAKDIGLPVILVVGLRLGCINHARLSTQSIALSGVTLLGWVGNEVDPKILKKTGNLATLRRLLPTPELAQLHYLPEGT